MAISNKGRMTSILEAINTELEDTLVQYANWQVDETGCRNPDKYDDEGKELQEKIRTLRSLRRMTEDVIAKVDEERPPKVVSPSQMWLPPVVHTCEAEPDTDRYCITCGKHKSFCVCPLTTPIRDLFADLSKFVFEHSNNGWEVERESTPDFIGFKVVHKRSGMTTALATELGDKIKSKFRNSFPFRMEWDNGEARATYSNAELDI